MRRQIVLEHVMVCFEVRVVLHQSNGKQLQEVSIAELIVTTCHEHVVMVTLTRECIDLGDVSKPGHWI